MSRVQLSQAAENDIRGIGRYIASDNPSRAISFTRELRHKAEAIGNRPLSFPSRPEWHAAIRSAVHKRYLILFCIETDCVRIARVIHGARDIAAIMKDFKP